LSGPVSSIKRNFSGICKPWQTCDASFGYCNIFTSSGFAQGLCLKGSILQNSILAELFRISFHPQILDKFPPKKSRHNFLRFLKAI
jgi:hypothetical protein